MGIWIGVGMIAFASDLASSVLRVPRLRFLALGFYLLSVGGAIASQGPTRGVGYALGVALWSLWIRWGQDPVPSVALPIAFSMVGLALGFFSFPRPTLEPTFVIVLWTLSTSLATASLSLALQRVLVVWIKEDVAPEKVLAGFSLASLGGWVWFVEKTFPKVVRNGIGEWVVPEPNPGVSVPGIGLLSTLVIVMLVCVAVTGWSNRERLRSFCRSASLAAAVFGAIVVGILLWCNRNLPGFKLFVDPLRLGWVLFFVMASAAGLVLGWVRKEVLALTPRSLSLIAAMDRATPVLLALVLGLLASEVTLSRMNQGIFWNGSVTLKAALGAFALALFVFVGASERGTGEGPWGAHVEWGALFWGILTVQLCIGLGWGVGWFA